MSFCEILHPLENYESCDFDRIANIAENELLSIHAGMKAVARLLWVAHTDEAATHYDKDFVSDATWLLQTLAEQADALHHLQGNAKFASRKQKTRVASAG